MCICHVLFYTYVNVTFVFINIYVYIIFFYNFFTSKNCLCFLSELQLKQQMCLDRRTSSNCRYITTPLPHFLRWGGGWRAPYSNTGGWRGEGGGNPLEGEKTALRMVDTIPFRVIFQTHTFLIYIFFSFISNNKNTFSLINILLYFLCDGTLFVSIYLCFNGCGVQPIFTFRLKVEIGPNGGGGKDFSPAIGEQIIHVMYYIKPILKKRRRSEFFAAFNSEFCRCLY